MNQKFIKTIVTISLLFSVAIHANFAQDEFSQSDLDKLQESRRLTNIYNKLQQVIKSNSIKNKHIEPLAKLIDSKIREKKLLLVEGTPEKDKLIMGAAKFIHTYNDMNESSYIVVNPKSLDLYEKQSSIVYSILINMLKGAYDYYTQNDRYLATQNNLIERKYYSADAIYIEALFIIDYLQTQKYHLTRFEEFLIRSFKNDNLGSFFATFYLTDLPFLHQLDDISAKKITLEAKMKEMYSIGTSLVNDFDTHDFKKESEWKSFLVMIKMYTYFYHTKQLVFDIQRAHSKTSVKEFDIKDYEDVNRIKNKIGKLINNNLDYFYYSHRHLMPMFNKL